MFEALQSCVGLDGAGYEHRGTRKAGSSREGRRVCVCGRVMSLANCVLYRSISFLYSVEVIASMNDPASRTHR